MRVGSFSTGVAKLNGAGELLERVWNDSTELWTDATSRNIEENHLRPLLQRLNDATEATTRLAELLNRAVRECGNLGE